MPTPLSALDALSSLAVLSTQYSSTAPHIGQSWSGGAKVCCDRMNPDGPHAVSKQLLMMDTSICKRLTPFTTSTGRKPFRYG